MGRREAFSKIAKNLNDDANTEIDAEKQGT